MITMCTPIRSGSMTGLRFSISLVCTPSMMVSQNTCSSTKVRPGMEHLPDDIIGHNGVRFRREPMGVLPRIVLDLDKKRDEYKALLRRQKPTATRRVP